MIYYICYSNEAYDKTKKFSMKMAKRLGKFERIIGYSPKDIDPEFYENNKKILSLTRGNGLWLWKPYFIHKTLCSMEYGDYLFYCDSGAFFIRPYNYIINSMKNEDIWVSDLPLIEKQFTKPEVFYNLDCENDLYYETNQIQATFICVKKTKKSVLFIKEWLDECCKEDNLSPHSNMEMEAKSNSFIAHREDQSILSLLAKKWSITPHLDPTQYGRVPKKYNGKGRMFIVPKHTREYPPSIILHRTPNVDIKCCIRQWIFTWLPIKLIELLSK